MKPVPKFYTNQEVPNVPHLTTGGWFQKGTETTYTQKKQNYFESKLFGRVGGAQQKLKLKQVRRPLFQEKMLYFFCFARKRVSLGTFFNSKMILRKCVIDQNFFLKIRILDNTIFHTSLQVFYLFKQNLSYLMNFRCISIAVFEATFGIFFGTSIFYLFIYFFL